MASTSDLLYDGGRQITPVATVADNLFLWTRLGGADKIIRFSVLLVLSSVIASGGVVTDSTATVIGAMIVAPLATPIIAVALGIVTVRPAQVGRSTSIIVGSVIVVILIGVLFGFLIQPFEYGENSQILGRISPTLTDLLVAFATGLVGAYAQSRDDLSGVLPGVAIAISLVPPLSVVGVCLQGGLWSWAFGALTLFLANAIAMIVSGVLVFTIAGYGNYARRNRTETRRAFRIVIAMLVLLLLPLAYFGLRTGIDAAIEASGQSAATSWLDGSGYRVISVSYSGGVLTAKVLGTGGLPPIDRFEEEFRTPFGTSVDLVVSEYNGQDVDLGQVS
ncbi:MAG: DUF389 domain-containing protein [Candidatus Nanopelagicales bacterium]